MLCAVLAAELSRLVDGIRLATDAVDEVAETQAAPSRHAEVLRRLEDFLDQGDIAADYLAKDERDLLRAALGEAAKPLLTRIEAFEYENAAAELRALRHRPNGAADGLA